MLNCASFGFNHGFDFMTSTSLVVIVEYPDFDFQLVLD
jgi:hypothetical protein